jgi:hypothetical protein
MLYNARKFTACQGSATFGRIALAPVSLMVLPVAKILINAKMMDPMISDALKSPNEALERVESCISTGSNLSASYADFGLQVRVMATRSVSSSPSIHERGT